MKFVGVSACAAGIAHTYMAKEKLQQAASSLGHEIAIETQGTIGTEDALTAQEISDADAVIIAADVSISGEERFRGKPLVKCPTETAIRSPKALLSKIQDKLDKSLHADSDRPQSAVG